MKKTVNPCLAAAVLILGMAGMGLRLLLLRFGVDEKGLLIPWNGFEIGLWVLGAVVLALALVFRKPAGVRLPVLESAGELAFALGIALLLPGSLHNASFTLDGIHMALSILGAAGLIFCVILRFRGRKGSFLGYALVCVFMAIHLVCRYRGWSSHPLVMDYIFDLLGCLSLLYFAYLRCHPGHPVLRRVVGLVGCFFCLTAMAGSRESLFYLGGALWMGTSLDAPGEPV